MGMYTELLLRCQLNKVPEEVSALLQYMADTSDNTTEADPLPSHDFFECARWRSIGWSNSYYFTPISCIKFVRSNISSNSWFLLIACDLKNYDSEIELFLDWLKPYYTDNHKMPIGWKRYEEEDEPTIIYS